MKISKRITILFFLAMLCSCSNHKQNHIPESMITDLGGIKLVSLYGSWEEMGRQYGKLVGENMQHILGFIQGEIGGDSTKLKNIEELATKLAGNYPYTLREFFKGASTTSGLTYEDLMMVNAVEYAEGFYCSGIAVWGDYAKGHLIYGRNYDAESFRPIAEDLVITVFHPSDGAIPTAIIGYAGELYAVNAFNKAGLFVELNNGMPSAGYDLAFDRFASTTSLLQLMFQAEDLNYVDAFFKSTNSFGSFIIGVADANEARAYEWCCEGVKRADTSTPDGLMVMTNHYVNPEWNYPIPSDENSWNSITRRANLIARTDSVKGNIDAGMMCEIISTPIENGGPEHYLTRYQIVCEPEAMMIYIKVEDTGNWIPVNIGSFL